MLSDPRSSLPLAALRCQPRVESDALNLSIMLTAGVAVLFPGGAMVPASRLAIRRASGAQMTARTHRRRLAMTVVGPLVMLLVWAGVPDVTAAADDLIPLGGGAGIVVAGSYRTLTTVGHDKTGEIRCFACGAVVTDARRPPGPGRRRGATPPSCLPAPSRCRVRCRSRPAHWRARRAGRTRHAPRCPRR